MAKLLLERAPSSMIKDFLFKDLWICYDTLNQIAQNDLIAIIKLIKPD